MDNNFQQQRAAHLVSMFEDEGTLFLKSEENKELLKGRKADPLGMKKQWGGKDYIKTATGWKSVGKQSGAAKAAHDYVHGENKSYNKEESGAKFAAHLKTMTANVQEHMDKFLADEKINIKDYENASDADKEKLNKKWRASEHYKNSLKSDKEKEGEESVKAKLKDKKKDENSKLDYSKMSDYEKYAHHSLMLQVPSVKDEEWKLHEDKKMELYEKNGGGKNEDFEYYVDKHVVRSDGSLTQNLEKYAAKYGKLHESESKDSHGVEVGKEYNHDFHGKVTVTKVEKNEGDKKQSISHHVTFKHSGGEETQGINGFKTSTTSKDADGKSFAQKELAKEAEDKEHTVSEHTAPYQGNKDAKWVKVTHSSGASAGASIDKFGSKDAAITAAKANIKSNLEKESKVEKAFDPSDILKSQAARLLSIYGGVDDIEKAGEGSKGGKVIGHTKSGKSIYEGHHESHNDFDANEHFEAAGEHNRQAHSLSSGSKVSKQKENKSQHHRDMAAHHMKEQTKVQWKNDVTYYKKASLEEQSVLDKKIAGFHDEERKKFYLDEIAKK